MELCRVQSETLYTVVLNTLERAGLETRKPVRRAWQYHGSKEFSNRVHSHDLVAFSLVISHDLLNHFPDVVYERSFAIVMLDLNKFPLYPPTWPYNVLSHCDTFESKGVISDYTGRTGITCGCPRRTRMNGHFPLPSLSGCQAFSPGSFISGRIRS